MLHTSDPVPCAKNPDLWFSGVASKQEQAKKICLTQCWRKIECAADAVALEQQMGQTLKGIHGGMTETERKNIESFTRIG